MRSRTLALTFTLLLAAGCGSGGLGGIDLGSILGSTGSEDPSDVRGTVTRVDTSDRRIDLDVSYINNLRENQSGKSIYYDSNTVVEYDGNTYRPEDLERGDEIAVRGSNSGGRFVADRITVTRNVRR